MVKIWSITAEIFLIWTNVARTIVAWTNVTVTVGIYKRWSQEHIVKVSYGFILSRGFKFLVAPFMVKN